MSQWVLDIRDQRRLARAWHSSIALPGGSLPCKTIQRSESKLKGGLAVTWFLGAFLAGLRGFDALSEPAYGLCHCLYMHLYYFDWMVSVQHPWMYNEIDSWLQAFLRLACRPQPPRTRLKRRLDVSQNGSDEVRTPSKANGSCWHCWGRAGKS